MSSSEIKSVEYEGNLKKMTQGLAKRWQDRYFVCKDSTLSYYYTDADYKAKKACCKTMNLIGAIMKPLDKAELQPPDSQSQSCFEVIAANSQKFVAAAPDYRTLKKWNDVIKAAAGPTKPTGPVTPRNLRAEDGTSLGGAAGGRTEGTPRPETKEIKETAPPPIPSALPPDLQGTGSFSVVGDASLSGDADTGVKKAKKERIREAYVMPDRSPLPRSPPALLPIHLEYDDFICFFVLAKQRRETSLGNCFKKNAIKIRKKKNKKKKIRQNDYERTKLLFCSFFLRINISFSYI